MSISAVSPTSTYPIPDSQASGSAPLSREDLAKRLAASQTISADADVRLILANGYADSNYRTPLEQAWDGLNKSLATGANATTEGGATGDLSAAGIALSTYSRLLPSSLLYISTLTAPSEQFLSDLKALGSAINTGDLAAAQAEFAAAQTDAPNNIGGAFGLATDTGDTNNLARLSIEGAGYWAGYLTSIGYTQSNANIEANAIVLGQTTEAPVINTPQDAAQEKQAADQSTTIARIVSANALTSNQLVATGDSAAYKAYYTIFNSDPFGIANQDKNVYNLRDSALNDLVNTLTGKRSEDANSAASSGSQGTIAVVA